MRYRGEDKGRYKVGDSRQVESLTSQHERSGSCEKRFLIEGLSSAEASNQISASLPLLPDHPPPIRLPSYAAVNPIVTRCLRPDRQPRPANGWPSIVSWHLSWFEGETVMWILYATLGCGALLALAAFASAARRRPLRPSDLTPVSDGWRAEQRGRNLPD